MERDIHSMHEIWFLAGNVHLIYELREVKNALKSKHPRSWFPEQRNVKI